MTSHLLIDAQTADHPDAGQVGYRAQCGAHLTDADYAQIERFAIIAAFLMRAGVRMSVAWARASEWIDEHSGLPSAIAKHAVPMSERSVRRFAAPSISRTRVCLRCNHLRRWPADFRRDRGDGHMLSYSTRCNACAKGPVQRATVPVRMSEKRCAFCLEVKPYPQGFIRKRHNHSPVILKRKCTMCSERDEQDKASESALRFGGVHLSRGIGSGEPRLTPKPGAFLRPSGQASNASGQTRALADERIERDSRERPALMRGGATAARRAVQSGEGGSIPSPATSGGAAGIGIVGPQLAAVPDDASVYFLTPNGVRQR